MKISKHNIIILLSLICPLLIIACSSFAPLPNETNNEMLFESFSISRDMKGDKVGANIDYYLSKPSLEKNYPIVILVGGSTDKEHIDSIASFHKYFTKQLSQNNLGAVSVDGWGVNLNHTNESEFMKHYTRTQILSNYQQVITYLKKNPPTGWNGKLAVLGVSEGGPIATQLNEQNQAILATVLWSGAINSSWRDTLWLDMHEVYNKVCIPQKNPVNDCYDIATKDVFESRIDYALMNPSPESYFFNMTNMYVADGVNFPTPNYQKLHGDILVVTGAKDTIIDSSDTFVKNANINHLSIEYWRVESMDHSIRNHPDLIDNSFVWLSNRLNSN